MADEKLSINDFQKQYGNEAMSVADFEKQYQTPAPSVSGFLGNVVKSGGKFLGDVGQAIAHPIDTATGAFQIGAGALEKPIRAGANALNLGAGGKPIPPTPEEEKFNSVLGAYGQRYGSIPQALHTAYTDPVGVAADIATVAGGVGAGAKMLGGMGKAAKVAEVAGAAEQAANPLSMASRAAGAALDSAPVQRTAERMYESSLKIPPAMDRGERLKRVQTGLQERIPVSERGLNEVQARIDGLNQQIADKIKQGAVAGETVDPLDVHAKLADTRQKFGNQVNPQADLNSINQVGSNFLQQFEVPPSQPGGLPTYSQIPLDQAQAMKQGTYQQLRGKYGELKSAEIEAEKPLARGLKEGIEQVFPEVQGLNARDGRLIALEQSLERFANRHSNRDLVGIGTPLKVLGGHAAAGGMGTVGGMLLAALEDPAIKSRLAIIMSNPPKIAARPAALLTPTSRLPAAQNQGPPDMPQYARGGIAGPPPMPGKKHRKRRRR